MQKVLTFFFCDEPASSPLAAGPFESFEPLAPPAVLIKKRTEELRGRSKNDSKKKGGNFWVNYLHRRRSHDELLGCKPEPKVKSAKGEEIEVGLYSRGRAEMLRKKWPSGWWRGGGRFLGVSGDKWKG